MNKFFNGIDEKIQYEEIIVCLFDGEYNLGAAALINSLVKFDFKGLIYLGYRGELPDWVSQLKFIEENCYSVSNDITIHFKEVDTSMHLGYYKPYFLKETFEKYKYTNKVYYFDADIVITTSWRFYSNWLQEGASLCLDNSFHFIHHSHPWRREWKELAPPNELGFNNTNYYFNSGFLGIERESIKLIDRWIRFTEKHQEIGRDINSFDKADYISVKSDQDLLNAAITISPDVEVSIIGTEGMGFTFPASIMAHAIGGFKPWNNSFLIQLVKSGHKPNLADKSFFANCEHPLNIFSPFDFKIKKIDLFIASFFGRILG